jgi:hypothetical protein
MWLSLFSGSLQIVPEPPNNTRSCGTEALNDVTLTRMFVMTQRKVIATFTLSLQNDESI